MSYADKYVKVGSSEERVDPVVVNEVIDDKAPVVQLLPGTLKLLNCSVPVSLHNSTSVGTFQLISCEDKYMNLTNRPNPLATTIVGITPTYKRWTQKSDLVALCQTIMNVPNFLWIVIEDSHVKTALVKHVLHHCKVNSIHLNAITSKESKKAMQRGVEQRNTGLDWARRYCIENCRRKCNGVVYFMDDDNKYDLRLFQQVFIFGLYVKHD